MKRPLALVLAIVCACIAWLAGVRTSVAQVGGGTGPMPKHFPHATPTPVAAPSGVPGKIRISGVDGEAGPIVLSPKNGGYVGVFVVWNDGAGPLTVSRVAMRTDDDDPRLPPRFTARFADGGGGSSVLQPHSSKRVNVTWIPDRERRLHEAIGHVVLTSTDDAAGEVAMGFVAPLQGPLGLLTRHLLTLLLLLPLLGAVVALAMHLVGYKELLRLRGLMVALTAAQCLLAIVLYEGFSGAVTRADGNDGFQFIERSVLLHGIGAEYFVGVDGLSISLVLLLALIGFVASVASYGVPEARMPRGLAFYYGFFGLLLSATMGVFVALDLSFFTAMWVAMLVALLALVATGAAVAPRLPLRRPTTVVLASFAGVSALLLLFGTTMLYLHSDPTFLADGTRTTHTFAVPELMRVAYNAKHLEMFGCSWVKVVWGALFVAFGVLVPLAPLQRGFVRALAELPTPIAVVLGAVVLKTGVYGLLRVSLSILPDGSRWAATTLVVFGVASIAYSAVEALRARSFVEVVGYAGMGQLGFALLGLGAMTREGIGGCLLQMTSQGLIVATLLLVTGVLHDRAKSGAEGGRTLADLAAAARGTPYLAVIAAAGFLGLAGAPGQGGFWGELLPVLGAFSLHRIFTLLGMAGGVTLAVSQLRGFRLLFAGDAGAAQSEGRPLVFRELASLLPLLALSIALGLRPAPFLGLVQGGVSDANVLVNPPGPDEVARTDATATMVIRPLHG